MGASTIARSPRRPNLRASKSRWCVRGETEIKRRSTQNPFGQHVPPLSTTHAHWIVSILLDPCIRAFVHFVHFQTVGARVVAARRTDARAADGVRLQSLQCARHSRGDRNRFSAHCQWWQWRQQWCQCGRQRGQRRQGIAGRRGGGRGARAVLCERRVQDWRQDVHARRCAVRVCESSDSWIGAILDDATFTQF